MESWLAAPITASVMVSSGSSIRPLATSPNCRSRSTITTPMGAILPSPTARLVATVVLPTPPLGDITAMIRPPAPWSTALRPGVPGPAAGRLRRRLARSSMTRMVSASAPGSRRSRTPARIACSTVSGVAVSGQDDADLRVLKVHDRRRASGSRPPAVRGRGSGPPAVLPAFGAECPPGPSGR